MTPVSPEEPRPTLREQIADEVDAVDKCGALDSDDLMTLVDHYTRWRFDPDHVWWKRFYKIPSAGVTYDMLRYLSDRQLENEPELVSAYGLVLARDPVKETPHGES